MIVIMKHSGRNEFRPTQQNLRTVPSEILDRSRRVVAERSISLVAYCTFQA